MYNILPMFVNGVVSINDFHEFIWPTTIHVYFMSCVHVSIFGHVFLRDQSGPEAAYFPQLVM